MCHPVRENVHRGLGDPANRGLHGHRPGCVLKGNVMTLRARATDDGAAACPSNRTSSVPLRFRGTGSIGATQRHDPGVSGSAGRKYLGRPRTFARTTRGPDPVQASHR